MLIGWVSLEPSILTNEGEERLQKSITCRCDMGSFFKLGTAWHLLRASIMACMGLAQVGQSYVGSFFTFLLGNGK